MTTNNDLTYVIDPQKTEKENFAHLLTNHLQSIGINFTITKDLFSVSKLEDLEDEYLNTKATVKILSNKYKGPNPLVIIYNRPDYTLESVNNHDIGNRFNTINLFNSINSEINNENKKEFVKNFLLDNIKLASDTISEINVLYNYFANIIIKENSLVCKNSFSIYNNESYGLTRILNDDDFELKDKSTVSYKFLNNRENYTYLRKIPRKFRAGTYIESKYLRLGLLSNFRYSVTREFLPKGRLYLSKVIDQYDNHNNIDNFTLENGQLKTSIDSFFIEDELPLTSDLTVEKLHTYQEKNVSDKNYFIAHYLIKQGDKSKTISSKPYKLETVNGSLLTVKQQINSYAPVLHLLEYDNYKITYGFYLDVLDEDNSIKTININDDTYYYKRINVYRALRSRDGFIGDIENKFVYEYEIAGLNSYNYTQYQGKISPISDEYGYDITPPSNFSNKLREFDKEQTQQQLLQSFRLENNTGIVFNSGNEPILRDNDFYNYFSITMFFSKVNSYYNNNYGDGGAIDATNRHVYAITLVANKGGNEFPSSGSYTDYYNVDVIEFDHEPSIEDLKNAINNPRVVSKGLDIKVEFDVYNVPKVGYKYYNYFNINDKILIKPFTPIP